VVYCELDLHFPILFHTVYTYVVYRHHIGLVSDPFLSTSFQKSFEAINGIDHRNETTGERKAKGKHIDHHVPILVKISHSPTSSSLTHRSLLENSRSTVVSPTCFSTSSSYLGTFKNAGNSDHRVVLSNFAASHWSGVGCMRFHRIAHPFLPSSYDTNIRLAKCTLQGVPDCGDTE